MANNKRRGRVSGCDLSLLMLPLSAVTVLWRRRSGDVAKPQRGLPPAPSSLSTIDEEGGVAQPVARGGRRLGHATAADPRQRVSAERRAFPYPSPAQRHPSRLVNGSGGVTPKLATRPVLLWSAAVQPGRVATKTSEVA